MHRDIDFMRLHVEALFTIDGEGRLLAVNDEAGRPAPRFFLGRTAEVSAWWFRHDVDAGLARALEALCRSESPGDRAGPVPGSDDPFVDLIARWGSVETVWAGPAFRFPDDLLAGGDAVRVTEASVDVLRPRFDDWVPDVAAGAPMAAALEAGKAVAVCCSVRMSTEAHEAGVETHPDFRRRGYGVTAVAAWARIVREMDRMPLYSTSWTNHASRALADRLGLIRFGSDLHIT